jgi:hypothetical protein
MKASPPEALADHGYGVFARTILGRSKYPPQYRSYAEGLEVLCVDALALDALGCVLSREVIRGRRRAGDARKGAVLLANIAEIPR